MRQTRRGNVRAKDYFMSSIALVSAMASGTAMAQDVATDVVEKDEIVVTGQRASLEKSAEIKKESDQVVDSIVSDDIGKFLDNTVAAALQRVP